jgi:hypothetical protein
MAAKRLQITRQYLLQRSSPMPGGTVKFAVAAAGIHAVTESVRVDGRRQAM